MTGERARFQLFGDTMNTAARMESTGIPGRIHTSTETAELLRSAKKEFWLEKRAERVKAKGLGELETYWVNVTSELSGHSSQSSTSDETNTSKHLSPVTGKEGIVLKHRTQRLVNWNVEALLRLLKQVVAQRFAQTGQGTYARSKSRKTLKFTPFKKGDAPLEEVCEIIDLPKIDSQKIVQKQDPDSVDVPQAVVDELTHFVSAIASLYRDNPCKFVHANSRETKSLMFIFVVSRDTTSLPFVTSPFL